MTSGSSSVATAEVDRFIVPQEWSKCILNYYEARDYGVAAKKSTKVRLCCLVQLSVTGLLW